MDIGEKNIDSVIIQEVKDEQVLDAKKSGKNMNAAVVDTETNQIIDIRDILKTSNDTIVVKINNLIELAGIPDKTISTLFEFASDHVTNYETALEELQGVYTKLAQTINAAPNGIVIDLRTGEQNIKESMEQAMAVGIMRDSYNSTAQTLNHDEYLGILKSKDAKPLDNDYKKFAKELTPEKYLELYSFLANSSATEIKFANTKTNSTSVMQFKEMFESNSQLRKMVAINGMDENNFYRMRALIATGKADGLDKTAFFQYMIDNELASASEIELYMNNDKALEMYAEMEYQKEKAARNNNRHERKLKLMLDKPKITEKKEVEETRLLILMAAQEKDDEDLKVLAEKLGYDGSVKDIVKQVKKDLRKSNPERYADKKTTYEMIQEGFYYDDDDMKQLYDSVEEDLILFGENKDMDQWSQDKLNAHADKMRLLREFKDRSILPEQFDALAKSNTEALEMMAYIASFERGTYIGDDIPNNTELSYIVNALEKSGKYKQYVINGENGIHQFDLGAMLEDKFGEDYMVKQAKVYDLRVMREMVLEKNEEAKQSNHGNLKIDNKENTKFVRSSINKINQIETGLDIDEELDSIFEDENLSVEINTSAVFNPKIKGYDMYTLKNEFVEMKVDPLEFAQIMEGEMQYEDLYEDFSTDEVIEEETTIEESIVEDAIVEDVSLENEELEDTLESEMEVSELDVDELTTESAVVDEIEEIEDEQIVEETAQEKPVQSNNAIEKITFMDNVRKTLFNTFDRFKNLFSRKDKSDENSYIDIEQKNNLVNALAGKNTPEKVQDESIVNKKFNIDYNKVFNSAQGEKGSEDKKVKQSEMEI